MADGFDAAVKHRPPPDYTCDASCEVALRQTGDPATRVDLCVQALRETCEQNGVPDLMYQVAIRLAESWADLMREEGWYRLQSPTELKR